MVRVQLNTSLKRFISLTTALSVLHQAAVFASLGEELGKISPSAQAVFTMHPDTTPYTDTVSFLGQSKRNFDQLHKKIHTSVSEGNIIHVEDGEGDDILHNLLSVFAGSPPEQVHMHNGYYKVRKTAATRVWGYIAEKFGIRKPEIFTIRGGTKDTISEFDAAEGSGLLDPYTITELQSESLNSPTYDQEVAEARSRLKDTLDKNPFTTIVLKTAPGGLIEVLDQYKDKVAIIWTGPIRKQAYSNGWEAKFNYHRATADTDKLVKLGIPIVIVSPYVGNSRMQAIIGKEFKDAYSEYIKLHPDYQGFSKMATIKKDENTLISHYINSLADVLMSNVIDQLPETEQKLQLEKNQIELEKEIGKISLEDYERKISNHKSQVVASTSLGTRWFQLREKKVNDQEFREYCPVDLFASIITDKSLKSSVKEVMQVEINPLGNSILEVKPSMDSEIYIIGQLDSEGLEKKIQKIFTWMHSGEPKIV